MALRNILHDDDPILLKKSRSITDFNPRLHELIDDMRETLLTADGMGLAAVQVGVLRRVVLVVDTAFEGLDPESPRNVIELVNPEIIESSGEQSGPEGCLSVPGVYGLVTRPNFVKIRAQDRFGNPFKVSGAELTARAFCHELDHLEGKLFMGLAEKILTPEELEELQKADSPEEIEEQENL